MGQDITAEKKPMSLTEGNIWKAIFFFAMPIMASSFFQQFYNIVDSIVVGRFESSEALAAVSSVTPVINLIITLFLGLTTGAGVVVAIYIGAQDEDATEKAVHTAIVIGVISGLICTVIGLGVAPFVPGWMNFNEETAKPASQYLMAYFAGILPMLMYNMGSAFPGLRRDLKLYFRRDLCCDSSLGCDRCRNRQQFSAASGSFADHDCLVPGKGTGPRGKRKVTY